MQAEPGLEVQTTAGYTLTETAPPGPSPKIESQQRERQDSFRTEKLGDSPRVDSLIQDLLLDPQVLRLDHETPEVLTAKTCKESECFAIEPPLSAESVTAAHVGAELMPLEAETTSHNVPEKSNQESTLGPDPVSKDFQTALIDNLEHVSCTDGVRGEFRSLSALRKMRAAVEMARNEENIHKYNRRSLFLFTLENPVRKLAIICIEWK
eukprot:3712383-Rhodomonas_salina.1